MAKNAESKVGFMDIYNFYVHYFYMGVPYGIGLAIVWFLIKVAVRHFRTAIPSQFLRMVMVKRKALQLEALGYQVYCYISWADGKKIRVKDMEKENSIQVKDPLIFEHHRVKDLPFVLDDSFLFYNNKKRNIVGYFHRINSKEREVFKGKLVEIEYRAETEQGKDK